MQTLWWSRISFPPLAATTSPERRLLTRADALSDSLSDAHRHAVPRRSSLAFECAGIGLDGRVGFLGGSEAGPLFHVYVVGV